MSSSAEAMADSPRVTYFTLADSGYFLGAVALVNSLALTGNGGRIVVVDTGLEAWQRARLEPAAAVIPLDAPVDLPVTFYKSHMGESMEGDVVVYIDADIIVTDSLAEVVAAATTGAIVAAPDGQPRRFFPDWAEMLQLTEPLRRETYVNAGFLALSPQVRPGFYRRWRELCDKMLAHSPQMHALSFEEALITPAGWHDQDALNAMLMSELPVAAVDLIDADRVVASAEMTGVECVDSGTLECWLNGKRTLFLHYLNDPKPWQRSGWIATSDNAYVRLLVRLLRRDDVPVPIAERELPMWLRDEGGLRRAALFAGIRSVRAASHAVPSSTRRRARSFLARR